MCLIWLKIIHITFLTILPGLEHLMWRYPLNREGSILTLNLLWQQCYSLVSFFRIGVFDMQWGGLHSHFFSIFTLSLYVFQSLLSTFHSFTLYFFFPQSSNNGGFILRFFLFITFFMKATVPLLIPNSYLHCSKKAHFTVDFFLEGTLSIHPNPYQVPLLLWANRRI